MGLAVHPLKDQQVGLPVPNLLALTGLGRTLGDRSLQRDLQAAGLAAIEATPRSDRLRPARGAGRRRDAGEEACQHLGHMLAQADIADEFALALALALAVAK